MPAATVIIYIQNVKKIRTKKGDPMAFVDGIDLTGTLSITIFPKLFKEISPLLVNEKVLLITGKIEQQRGRDALQMIANRIVSVMNFGGHRLREWCQLDNGTKNYGIS